MKKFFFLFILLICYSCEEVVDVELEESAPRLVVEASLLWNEDKQENVQSITLTTTAPYFEEDVPAAEGASVSVFSTAGEEYIFEEVATGIFRNKNIPPVVNGEYRLVIEYQNEVYIASEELIPVPQLDYVTQDSEGFSGDEYEFRVFFRDPPNEENFYLFRYTNESLSLQIYNDEFTDGNETFALFDDEDAEPGDLVGFQIQGISERYYEYLYILRSQSGGASGGPFQTQPSIVRGNIINTTNPENFPFGFFRLSGTNFLPYEVK